MLDELLIGLLLYGVFPLWLIAGFADYCCHRATRIHQTTGLAESSLHVVQYLQVAIAVALSLLLEATSLVLLLVIVLALLHLATGYLDIAYTTARRHISPPEQHVHSYMEVLPLVATVLLVVLHWSQAAAIFNGDEASWLFVIRQQMPNAGPAAFIAGGMALGGLAVGEELVRCARYRAEAAAAVS